MPRSAFIPAPQPQLSNTPPQTPQIDTQRPMRAPGSRITTFAFVVVLVVVLIFISIASRHQAATVTEQAREAIEEKADLEADRPITDYSVDMLHNVAHAIPAYEFTGSNVTSQFIVDPALAECDGGRWPSDEHAAWTRTHCLIPLADPYDNPLNVSNAILTITTDWTHDDSVVKCEMNLGEVELAEIPCS